MEQNFVGRGDCIRIGGRNHGDILRKEVVFWFVKQRGIGNKANNLHEQIQERKDSGLTCRGDKGNPRFGVQCTHQEAQEKK